MNPSSRRKFLQQVSLAAVTLPLSRKFNFALTNIASAPSIQFPTIAKDRISVASYPFREFVAGPEHKAGNPSIELINFAQHVHEKFGISRIEPWSPHFPSTDSKYIGEFRSALEKSGCSVVDIAVDGGLSPYAPNRNERDQAIAFSKKWIDVATVIASPSVRTNIPQSKDSKPDVAVLAASLSRVADYGATKNVVVHLENDNPVSEDPFFLAQVIDKVNSPWLRALPDFGNTLSAHLDDEAYAYRAIDVMFARAYGICHVKSEEINEQGKTARVDLPRTFAILKQHHYAGYCSIEYDAPGDPYKATAELIKATERGLA